jgi:hypothetical protein
MEGLMSNIDAERPKESFRVSFVIQGSGLDFEAIARGINIAPSHIHRIGDISKAKHTYHHDMWSITSPLKPQDKPLNAHLKWLAKQLNPSYEFIKSLKSSAEIYIYCGYTTENEQSGFTLSSEALSILTDLGISMDVSILSI